MPIQCLTERALANTKPRAGQHVLWDTTVKYFGVRVSQGGTKTFIVMHGRHRDRITIGRYPTISLAQARQKAKEVLAERTLNKTRAPRITFDEARTTFFNAKRQRNKPSTIEEYERIFERHFARLRTMRLSNISPHDIQRILDRLTSTPSECTHCYAVARTFFTFCAKRRYIERSPMEGMDKPSKYRPRTRVLSDDELVKVWRAAEDYGYAFGRIVQLLILTGQRRSEIGKLKWSYIKDGKLTLPPEFVKNNREHTIPLGAKAAGILAQLPRLGDHVFMARGNRKPFNGWQSCTFTLMKACATEHWTLHDLRRTFATRLAELGVAPHVIERLLNHVDGTLSRIALVYNRASYLKEMREALELWESHLARTLAKRPKIAA